MIFRYDIEQGSYEWHEAKYRKIGGSRASGLFKKSDALINDLMSEYCEDFTCDFDEYLSYDMKRGQELEPEARMKLEEYLKIEFKSCGLIQSESIPILALSPDGISEDETISCEIKCPAAKRHYDTLSKNEIPLDNIDQCIHYFTVNEKLEKHFFLSYRPENNYKQLFVKELTRKSFVNIGTPLKRIMITIDEVVEINRKNAMEIENEIKNRIELLKF